MGVRARRRTQPPADSRAIFPPISATPHTPPTAGPRMGANDHRDRSRAGGRRSRRGLFREGRRPGRTLAGRASLHQERGPKSRGAARNRRQPNRPVVRAGVEIGPRFRRWTGADREAERRLAPFAGSGRRRVGRRRRATYKIPIGGEPPALHRPFLLGTAPSLTDPAAKAARKRARALSKAAPQRGASRERKAEVCASTRLPRRS